MFEQAGDHAPARALPLACTPPLPELAPRGWGRWIDTPLEFPDDICAWTEAPVVREATYPVQPRSLVLQWQQVLLTR